MLGLFRNFSFCIRLESFFLQGPLGLKIIFEFDFPTLFQSSIFLLLYLISFHNYLYKSNSEAMEVITLNESRRFVNEILVIHKEWKKMYLVCLFRDFFSSFGFFETFSLRERKSEEVLLWRVKIPNDEIFHSCGMYVPFHVHVHCLLALF